MEHNGDIYIGGFPPDDEPPAEVYQWNGLAFVAHDPFPDRMAIGSLYVSNGTLRAIGYALGNAVPQVRYLAASGEWKIVEPEH